jgi:phage portal protein BeeE
VANLLRSLLGPSAARANETTPVSITDWSRMYRPGAQISYAGQRYQAFSMAAPSDAAAYDANSVVFACEMRRLTVFSEARFQWRQLQSGRPGDLFGTRDLTLLERPWRGATTRDLLISCEYDVATAGNSFWTKAERPGEDTQLVRLDPAHMKILTEAWVDPISGNRVGETLIGYAYVDGRDVTIYAPEDVAHYKPYPSSSQFRGKSWISGCLPDVAADQAITDHKLTALAKGANLNVVVSLDAAVTPDQFKAFVQEFREAHEGPENAGKTVFFGGGADVKTVGQTFENLALKATQGATETRIAACALTPPVLVGLSEGLQGSSLNAGNYGAAKRSFVDGAMRPAWGAFCGAFQWLVNVPPAAQLWYDDRDIPFLREDVKDQAEILSANATTINQLITAGYNPDAVIRAVAAGDIRGLSGQHSGLYSVQLQQAGASQGAST